MKVFGLHHCPELENPFPENFSQIFNRSHSGATWSHLLCPVPVPWEWIPIPPGSTLIPGGWKEQFPGVATTSPHPGERSRAKGEFWASILHFSPQWWRCCSWRAQSCNSAVKRRFQGVDFYEFYAILFPCWLGERGRGQGWTEGNYLRDFRVVSLPAVLSSLSRYKNKAASKSS